MNARKSMPLLAVAALICVWWSWDLRRSEEDADPGIGHGPDQHMRDVEVSAMDERGLLKYRVFAARMAFYEDRDITELWDPRMEMLRGKEAEGVMEGQADKGWISSDQKEIWLEDNVRLRQWDETGKRTLQINTSKACVLPEDSYAETDQALRILGEGFVIESIGMRTFLEEGRIELDQHLSTRIQGKGSVAAATDGVNL